MNITFTVSKLFILIAVVLWLVVAIIGVADRPLEHELEWITVGLASFGLGFLI